MFPAVIVTWDGLILVQNQESPLLKSIEDSEKVPIDKSGSYLWLLDAVLFAHYLSSCIVVLNLPFYCISKKLLQVLCLGTHLGRVTCDDGGIKMLISAAGKALAWDTREWVQLRASGMAPQIRSKT